MKALILNSGMGSRMGEATKEAPKCMSVLSENETIFSRQVKMLQKIGVSDFVVTTGAHRDVLVAYAQKMFPDVTFTFVHNDVYDKTNYIYSIYLAKDELVDDILLMHGDLIFDETTLNMVVNHDKSCGVTDFSIPLPEKDFKAVIKDGKIEKVGIEFFEHAVAFQPLYKLYKQDWLCWLRASEDFCTQGNTKVYAENALNTITNQIDLMPIDIQGYICQEVDTLEDLTLIREKLMKI